MGAPPVSLTANPIMISRWSGLGDVCMALCAAHAYHAVTGAPVHFYTAPLFRPLARACPHISVVVEDGSMAETMREVPLHDASHGLSAIHEVDSFCEALGLHGVEPFLKTLDLEIPSLARSRVDFLLGPSSPHRDTPTTNPSPRIICIHPGAVDPNRTWPAAHWISLVESLLWNDFRVALVGDPAHVHPLADNLDPMAPMNRLLDFTGVLSVLETVALLQRCAALVSTDGGPIQLAGASRCAIVGIYSVVSGANRIPYRPLDGGRVSTVSPFCSSHPCYAMTAQPTVWQHEVARLAEEGHTTLGPILANWCPGFSPSSKESRYHCLNRDITPAHVFRAIMEVL